MKTFEIQEKEVIHFYCSECIINTLTVIDCINSTSSDFIVRIVVRAFIVALKFDGVSFSKNP